MAQKNATRQHIIDAAGRLFRQHGIDAVGVDAIMHAAGLTHGGFYGHFPSKEALVAEVTAASLARAAARWQRIGRENPPEVALEQIVGGYLDPAHVAAVERGCVLTTLGAELARRPEARAGLAESVRVMTGVLQACRPGADAAEALAMLSTMVGAVVLARLAGSPEMAAAILRAAAGKTAPEGIPAVMVCEGAPSTSLPHAAPQVGDGAPPACGGAGFAQDDARGNGLTPRSRRP